MLPREGRADRAAGASGLPSRPSAPTKTAKRAEQAARLAKADLTTDMVREFTELQGTMGGIYAREEGLPEEDLEGHLLPLPADRRRGGCAAHAGAARQGGRHLGGDLAGRQARHDHRVVCRRRTLQRFARPAWPSAAGAWRPQDSHRPPRADRDQHALSIEPLIAKAAESFKQFDRQAGAELSLVGLLARAPEIRRRAARVFDGAYVRSVAAAGDLTPLTWRRKLQALPEFAGSPAFDNLATTFKRVKNIARELKESAPIPFDQLCGPARASETTLFKDLQARYAAGAVREGQTGLSWRPRRTGRPRSFGRQVLRRRAGDDGRCRSASRAVELDGSSARRRARYCRRVGTREEPQPS